ncbi:LamG-like jellyroll fold domain-containing protein [Streptomyces sp. NPDC012888]|uniref:LamG-like jellyroll fold domain-containing protein n=1 Tax=Streptomyces sp. NPDC012888 TaxID=3364855 RepID=UPI0036ACDB56
MFGLVAGVAFTGWLPPGAATAAPAAPSAPSAPTAGGGTAGQQETPESLALAEAKKSGKDVPVAAMRREAGDVVAKPDGSLVATVYTKPVRTLKNGAWQDIDTSLRKAGDGSVAPRATLPDLAFSGGGDQPLVRMGQAGKEVRLSWPKPLPAPVLDGDTAEYRSILPDVDLRLTATETGFTQLIVVKTPAAAKNPALDRLKLGLSAPGLTTRQNGDGSLKLTDASGGTVFEAPKPVMFDSSPGLADGGVIPSAVPDTAPAASVAKAGALRAAPAGEQRPASAHAAPVGVSVPADQKSLVLTPDQALLDSPDTVFPVLIDPNLQTPRANGWAGISRYWENNAYYKFTGDFGTGLCIASGCASNDVKRVLYAFPVKGWGFVGKRILDAKLNVWETHAFSCTKKPLQLYATSRIGTGTTWKNSSSSSFWTQHLQTINAARGWNGCAAGYVEFGGSSSKALRDKVQQAANGDWVDLTLGLKAENESDGYAWKRFNSNAGLQVTYNLPPRQAPMSALSMSPGSVCSSTPLVITKHPQITAKVSDPDNEPLGVQFAVAWDNGDGTGMSGKWYSTGALGTAPPSTTFKASGSPFSVTLPTSVPKDKVINWSVRGWDGAEWGPWSFDGTPTACYFQIDTTKPAGPVTTSPDFPGSPDAQAPHAWTDGVGKYGTFTFDTTSTDAVKYQYALDQLPSAAREVATTGGASRTVTLLMEKEGPHFVSVRALDAAGNASEPTTYYFNVLRGHPQRAAWTMDDASGTSVAPDPSDLPATLVAGTAGAPGRTGTAVELSGARAADTTPVEYLGTGSAVLETDKSFTVSAWVKPSTLTPQHQAAVSQGGVHMASFQMGITAGKWAIKASSADASSGYTWSTSSSEILPVAGEWAHLTGVYDAPAKQLKLFVNGQQAPAATATLWNARGPMYFGQMRWRDTYTDPWFGALDEVRAYDRALAPAEAASLAAGDPLAGGRGAKAVWTLDETTGTAMAGRPETPSLSLVGPATTGTAGVQGKALSTGANGYATAGGPVVDGTRSFAVSAWVRRPAVPATDHSSKVVVTQAGAQRSEFSLYYSGYYRKWVFGRYPQDAGSPDIVRAVQPACTAGSTVGGVPCIGETANQWTHLVGVSDTVARKNRLYVDGHLVAEVDYAQLAPWTTSGPLMIGAGRDDATVNSHFGGDIDDVRVFDRIVTQPEVREMIKQRPQLVGRWKMDTAVSGKSPGEPSGTADAVLSATGAAIVAESGVAGNGTLGLTGPGGFASSAAAPRTNESFTVAGWASAGSPTSDMTVLSVAGTNQSAVSVGWHYDKTVDGQATGWWEAKVTGTDGATATYTTVTHTFDQSLWIGDWNHIAVVYDGFDRRLSLYVNGNLENQVCADDAPAGCVDHVSYAGVPAPFAAGAGLQFGRTRAGGAWTKPLTGEIDDVWAFQGVLGPEQITRLADPVAELDTVTGP